MNNKDKYILISAFACGPCWGSEIGMGWNWVKMIAKSFKTIVITSSYFKEEIEKNCNNDNFYNIPIFIYIDIGEKGMKYFWKQGDFRFYYYYNKWQKAVLKKVVRIREFYNIILIHQLNLIGYREPGYLWKIGEIPYIIGPLGGYSQIPLKYFNLLGTRDKIHYLLRNVINYYQMRYNIHTIEAIKNATKVILATDDGIKYVKRFSKSEPIIIPETGSMESEIVNSYHNNNKLIVTWIGIIKGSKALDIALEAISRAKNKDKIHFNIIGEGPNKKKEEERAKKLGIINVNWYGKLDNLETIKVLKQSDLLFFTSILETTSTVIFEAIENNIPVLCHNKFGFGQIIDESCGIKIEMNSPKNSIKIFANKLDYIVENREIINKLKFGCHKKSIVYSWAKKENILFKLYKGII